MIFNTWSTIENIASQNLTGVLQFPTTDFPLFWPLILFVIFLVITLHSYFTEIRREGKGDFISSLALSGFVTTSIAFTMSLLQVISRQTLITCLVISLVFIVIYLLTGKEGR